MGENTFFLSLTFPDMAPQAELLSKLAVGTDAMELRVVSTTTNITNDGNTTISGTLSECCAGRVPQHAVQLTSASALQQHSKCQF
jgi:hypothetical protein